VLAESTPRPISSTVAINPGQSALRYTRPAFTGFTIAYAICSITASTVSSSTIESSRGAHTTPHTRGRSSLV
jgi:hypothetical protein